MGTYRLVRLAEALPGIVAGLAIGGAWLASIGLFRSAKQIELEEGSYADGGVIRIALQRGGALTGRWGLAFTAAAIVLATFPASPSPRVPWWSTMLIAVMTALVARGIGWLHWKADWDWWP